MLTKQLGTNIVNIVMAEHYSTLKVCPELSIALESYQQYKEDIDIFFNKYDDRIIISSIVYSL